MQLNLPWWHLEFHWQEDCVKYCRQLVLPHYNLRFSAEDSVHSSLSQQNSKCKIVTLQMYASCRRVNAWPESPTLCQTLHIVYLGLEGVQELKPVAMMDDLDVTHF